MAEIVPAFVGAETLEAFAKQGPEGVDGPAPGGAQDRFEFGEAEFDRIQIGTIRGQIHQCGARGLDGASDPRDFVGAEVVGDHDVLGVECGDQDLFDVGEEARSVHRAVEHAWRRETGHAQRGNEGAGLPARKRSVVIDPLSARRAAVAPEQVRGHSRFIEEGQMRRIPGRRGLVPVSPGRGDVRPVVLAGPYGFF